MPAEGTIPLEGRTRRGMRHLFVSLGGCLLPMRTTQCLDYAQLHLGCRFAGKCNCEYLFRVINHRQQLQVALNQKLCFARPRGRLDDRRALDIQRVASRLFVVTK